MKGMGVAGWIIGTPLFFFGCWIVGTNWWGVRVNTRNRQRKIDKHYSSVPLLGPAFILYGLYVSPIDFQIWFWSAWLFDYPTYIMLWSLPLLIRELWKNE